ncbi:hypothetical protein C0993_010219 [Termitomyces sp. T159_Od127]|nr:hypothetical protein C0993_010219 [Termitomyces sp. T159_Od127]
MQNAAEVHQRLEEQNHSHQRALQTEIHHLQAEHQQQFAELTQAREEMENRIQELEQSHAQKSNLIEQLRLSAEAAARAEEVHETVRNIVSHDAEVIVDLQAQLDARSHRVEQLEAQIDSQTPHHVTAATREPPEDSQDSHSSNTESYAHLSATAREKLPADPRLAGIKAC